MAEQGTTQGAATTPTVGPRVPGQSPAGPAQPRHTGRHIVLLRNGLGRSGVQSLQKVAGLRVGVSADYEGTVRAAHLSPGEGMLFHRMGAALVHVDPEQHAAMSLRKGGDFVFIEPERFVHALQITSHAPSQAGVPGGPVNGAAPVSETTDTWGLQTTRASASRFSGRGVRVAVLDTGLDLQHPDFAGRAIASQSFVTGEAVDDGNGHGTYCAGVACGPSGPTQLPRYGVAGGADLYVGKVLGDDGSGADGNILAGIDWAVRSGCAVVSLSIGSPVDPSEPYSAVYEQVAQRALTAGTIIIAAAGNDSVRPDTIAPVDHPANCPSILAIAAIDVYLRIAPFSCGGINANGGEINIAAPGVAIRSAWPRPALYRTDSGTSMATPCVAGIAALLAEANPSVRGRDLQALLMQGARPLALPARDVGAGLVQAP